MKKVRSTGNNVGDNVRRFNNWIRAKLAEKNDEGKRFSQKDAAEYIGITQPEFSDKLNGRRGGFDLNQAMGIVDYFGESQKIKDLF